MRHPVLYGEYELTIDEKNRLLVPSEVRRSIVSDLHGDAFFLVPGVNKLPWLYTERYYESLVERVPQEMTPALDALAFDHSHFSRASKVEPDKQGRILLADRILRRYGLKRDVTLIGARDHLELWNREDWDAYRDQLDERSAEIAAAARMSRQTTPPPPPPPPPR